MDKITYTPLALGTTAVFLAGKRVGTIQQHIDGWQYTPKGQTTGGEMFPTYYACRKSLEEE